MKKKEISPVKGLKVVNLPDSAQEQLLILDKELSFKLPVSCDVHYGDDSFTGFFHSTEICYSGGFICFIDAGSYKTSKFFKRLLKEFNFAGKGHEALGEKEYEYAEGKKCLTRFFSRIDNDIERIFVYSLVELQNDRHMIFIQSTHKDNFEKVGYSFKLPIDTLDNYYED